MNTMDEKRIAGIIKNTYADVYVDYDFPSSYEGSGPIKAILLGNDPGNKIKGMTKKFKYVFGLREDGRYFRVFKENIKALGCLSIENLFIQNLCKNYFNCDTGRNKYWKESAKLWIPYLKQELDSKYDKDVPILATSQVLLEVLADYHSSQKVKVIPRKYYDDCIIIPKNDNFFNRDIIPFFRSKEYLLHRKENKTYASFLKSYFANF